MRQDKSTAKLDREAWLLILMNGLFAVANALSNIFVNVYIWKIEHDLIVLSRFHVANYIGMFLATQAAGRLSKHVDRVINIRLGVAILSVFYLTVLLLGSHSIEYIWLLGSLLGVGSGFFWLANSVLYFEITDRPNRDRFNGVNGLSAALAGIISPLISGLIISYVDHGFRGYRLIFAISLAIFLIAVWLSFSFRTRSAQGRYRLFMVTQCLKSPRNKWFWVSCSMFVQGLREGVMIYLTGLLVYMMTQHEMALAWFLTASAVVSLVANYLIGRFINESRRFVSMLCGTLMLGVVMLPFFFMLNTWSVFLLGVGIAFFYPFYYGPFTSTIFDVIGERDENVALRVEYIVTKDSILYLGRLTSVLLFIWWLGFSLSLEHMRWYLLAIAFVQVPVTFFMSRMKRYSV